MNTEEACIQLCSELKSIDPIYFSRQLLRQQQGTTNNKAPHNTSPAGLKERRSWKILTLKPKPSSSSSSSSDPQLPASPVASTKTSSFSVLDAKQQECLDKIVDLRKWLNTALFHPNELPDKNTYKSQVESCFAMAVQCAKHQQAERARLKASAAAAALNASSTSSTAPTTSKQTSKRFNSLVRKFSSKTNLNDEAGEDDNDDAATGAENDEDEEAGLLMGEEVEDPTLALTLLADMCGIQSCLSVLDMETFHTLVALCNEECLRKPSLRNLAAARCIANLSKRPSFLFSLCEPVRLPDCMVPKQAHAFQFGIDSARFPTTLRVLVTLSSLLSAKTPLVTDDMFALLTRVLDSTFDYGGEHAFALMLEKKEQDEFAFHVKQVCDTLWKSMQKQRAQHSLLVCFSHAITVWAAISQRSADCVAMRKHFVEKYLMPSMAQLDIQGLVTYFLDFEAKHDQVFPKDDVNWRDQTLRKLFPCALHMKTVPQCFTQWLASAIRIQPDYLCEEWIPDHLLDSKTPSHVTFGVTAISEAVLRDPATCAPTNGKLVSDKLVRFLPQSEAELAQEEDDEVLGRLRFPLTFAPAATAPQSNMEDAKFASLILPVFPVLLGPKLGFELVATYALHQNAHIALCALNVLATSSNLDELAVVNALDQADVDSVRTNSLLALLKPRVDKSSADALRGSMLFHQVAVMRKRVDLSLATMGAKQHARALARSRLRPLVRLFSKPQCKMTGRMNREVLGALNVLCATTGPEPDEYVEFSSVFTDLWQHDVLNTLANWVVNRMTYSVTMFLPSACEPVASRLLPPFATLLPTPLKFLCILDAILNRPLLQPVSDSAKMLLTLFFDQLANFKQQGGVEVHTCFLRLVDFFVRTMLPSDTQQAVVLQMIRDSPFKSNPMRICILRSLSFHDTFPSHLRKVLELEIVQEMEVNRDCAVAALCNLFKQRACLETAIHYATQALQHDVYLLAFLSWYESFSSVDAVSPHLKPLLLVSIWLSNIQQRTALLKRFFLMETFDDQNECVCAQTVAALVQSKDPVNGGLDVIQQGGNLLAIAQDTSESLQVTLSTLLLACAETIGDYVDKTRLFNVLWKVSVHVFPALQRGMVLQMWKLAVRDITDHTELFSIFLSTTHATNEEQLAMLVFRFMAPSLRVPSQILEMCREQHSLSMFQAKILICAAVNLKVCSEREEIFGYLLHIACFEPVLHDALVAWKRNANLINMVSPQAKVVAIEAAKQRMQVLNCESSAMLAIQLSDGANVGLLLEAVRIGERSLRQRGSSALLVRLLLEFPRKQEDEFYAKLVGVCLQFAETRRAAVDVVLNNKSLQQHRARLQQGFNMLGSDGSQAMHRFIAYANDLSVREVGEVGQALKFHKSALGVLNLLDSTEITLDVLVAAAADPVYLETCAAVLSGNWPVLVKARVYAMLGKLPDVTTRGNSNAMVMLVKLAMDDYLHGFDEAKLFLLHGQGLIDTLGSPALEQEIHPYSRDDVSKALFGWRKDEPKPHEEKEEEEKVVVAEAAPVIVKETAPEQKAVAGFVSLEELASSSLQEEEEEKEISLIDLVEEEPSFATSVVSPEQQRRKPLAEEEVRRSSDLDDRRKHPMSPTSSITAAATTTTRESPLAAFLKNSATAATTTTTMSPVSSSFKRALPQEDQQPSSPMRGKRTPPAGSAQFRDEEEEPTTPVKIDEEDDSKLQRELEAMKATMLDHPELLRPKIPTGKRRNPTLSPLKGFALNEDFDVV